MQPSRHLLANLRLIAIDNCLSDSYAWYVEKAYRHYSKNYNTPLQWAKDNLIEEEVIKTMMEDEMTELAIEELQEEREKLLADEVIKPFFGPNFIPTNAAEMSEDEWLMEQLRIVKAQEAKATQKSFEQSQKDLTESMQNLKSAGESLAGAMSMLSLLDKKPDDLDKPIDFGNPE
jgi:hypothetical protein